MKKLMFWGLVLFSYQYFGYAQEKAMEAISLPERLEGLARLLDVRHSPNPVYAEQLTEDRFVWKHDTRVMAPTDYVIIEFGAFLKTQDGWYLRTSMKPKDFDRLFKAKKGKLEAGRTYTYKKNWRYSPKLFGGDALWYFIAKNEKGEKVCGYQLVQTRGELKSN
ncbi:MAG: hypothetical protein AAFU64_14140, partial [Bacteroidota bacterium]